jgi:hypothetical protein
MVIALIVVSTFVVLVLSVLVAGLLRSHADILRSLHELGVGVGDPSRDEARSSGPVAVAAPTSHALGAAPVIAGLTPAGDGRAIAMDHGDHLTLLAFLSTGCTGCAQFWDALQRPGSIELPSKTRAVIVTKGADREVPSEVAAMTTGTVPVVMSTEAWIDYQVPGSPFFVLVDGGTKTKVGQGVASVVGQLAELVRRAEHDRTAGAAGRPVSGIDGPAREADVDETLRAAGIPPGHPSLYPRTLHDVFPFGQSSAAVDETSSL